MTVTINGVKDQGNVDATLIGSILAKDIVSGNPVELSSLEDDDGKNVLRVVDAAPFAYDGVNDELKIQGEVDIVDIGVMTVDVVAAALSVSAGATVTLREFNNEKNKSFRLAARSGAMTDFEFYYDTTRTQGNYTVPAHAIVLNVPIAMTNSTSESWSTNDMPIFGQYWRIKAKNVAGADRTLTVAAVRRMPT